MRKEQYDRYLTPSEVGKIFRVDAKTVTRWCNAGKLISVRTPGGHRRILESSVQAILEGSRYAGLHAVETGPETR